MIEGNALVAEIGRSEDTRCARGDAYQAKSGFWVHPSSGRALSSPPPLQLRLTGRIGPDIRHRAPHERARKGRRRTRDKEQSTGTPGCMYGYNKRSKGFWSDVRCIIYKGRRFASSRGQCTYAATGVIACREIIHHCHKLRARSNES